jgi:glyoxylase-like metal-dependent hydrolase (beta-lactamase superfamily II)
MSMSTDLPVAWFVSLNPGHLTLEGTCCYAVGRRRIVLVDPGPAIPGQMERLEGLVGDRPVSAICLTHAHADHSGLARSASGRFGAPLAASAATLERLGVDGNALRDGDTVEADDGATRLRAPGRAVFTGDLVLGTGSSAILHPDGHVGSCLASFGRVLSHRPGRLYPGHGPPVDEGEARLKHYADHRAERHAQVVHAVRSGARTVAALRRLVYGDLEADLQGAAEASIRAHVVHMREQGEEVPTIDGLDGVRLRPEEA